MVKSYKRENVEKEEKGKNRTQKERIYVDVNAGETRNAKKK